MVCEEWQKFDNFLSDMGVRPDGTTLERKDNDYGYFKGNCVWATYSEQNRNRRLSWYVVVDNELAFHLEDFSECVGLEYLAVYKALVRHKESDCSARFKALAKARGLQVKNDLQLTVSRGKPQRECLKFPTPAEFASKRARRRFYAI